MFKKHVPLIKFIGPRQGKKPNLAVSSGKEGSVAGSGYIIPMLAFEDAEMECINVSMYLLC